MKEIHDNLFIGDQSDYEIEVKGKKGWSIVHACKEPYHRKALGYKGRGAPKNHPEYLVAKRKNRLILNLIDPDNPNYIPKEIIDKAIKFIEKNLNEERKVLVHCNKGESRSPSIGLLYLAINGYISDESFQLASEEFVSIYPRYNPGLGIKKFLINNWDVYCS
ncbi:dual specificity protein phosphatase family protein [Halanaerobacter jeridensis]|uniref:Tyrosine specific protein phosphatases domain-containing protein n=1 Tax=Halanaerobacter jeridensis TaxID=706427 RepID=A0A938XUN0_9FIRM|nr:dual specificity protein phosphatase [Halanaerobacter jeridensis]MBM7558224.1 hypothetical protein [Halanaerobacter jeridensis]